MENLLIKIGELILIELDEVHEIQYSKEEENSFIIILNNGRRYKLELDCLNCS